MITVLSVITRHVKHSCVLPSTHGQMVRTIWNSAVGVILTYEGQYPGPEDICSDGLILLHMKAPFKVLERESDWAATATVTSSPRNHSSAYSEKLSEREPLRGREEEEDEGRGLVSWQGSNGPRRSEKRWASLSCILTHKWTVPTMRDPCTKVLSRCAHSACKCIRKPNNTFLSSMRGFVGVFQVVKALIETFCMDWVLSARQCNIFFLYMKLERQPCTDPKGVCFNVCSFINPNSTLM